MAGILEDFQLGVRDVPGLFRQARFYFSSPARTTGNHMPDIGVVLKRNGSVKEP
jgi:hypothetical protein